MEARKGVKQYSAVIGTEVPGLDVGSEVAGVDE